MKKIVIKLFGGEERDGKSQKCLNFFFESRVNMRRFPMEIQERQLFANSECFVGKMES